MSKNKMENTTIKPEIKTIAQQIDFKQLSLFGFRFVYDNNNTRLILNKGCKTLSISLDIGKDLYNIRKLQHRNFKIVIDEETKGVYCDQLQDIIEDFFKINYFKKHTWG